MRNLFKRYWLIGLIVLGVVGAYAYSKWYIPYRNLKNGFVVVSTFDCPKDHLIKAHLGSMIYHLKGDPYYRRTNAANGYCFDTANHAKLQGFRNSYNR